MSLQTLGTFANRPIRIALCWQLVIAVVAALLALGWAGINGAISALLGGLVIVVAGALFAIMVNSRRVGSAGESLRRLLRAEVSKIALIALLTWLVLTTYHDVVLSAFFASFVTTVLVYPFALLVRD